MVKKNREKESDEICKNILDMIVVDQNDNDYPLSPRFNLNFRALMKCLVRNLFISVEPFGQCPISEKELNRRMGTIMTIYRVESRKLERKIDKSFREIENE